MEDFAYLEEYPNYIFSSKGIVYRIWQKSNTVYQMKPFRNNCNMKYLRIGLVNKDGKRKNELVHRLIAKAFIPNPKNYTCVNHKDEDSLNNDVSNLEWCTYEYNNKYGNHLNHCVPALLRSIEKKKVKVVGQDSNGCSYEFDSITDAEKFTGALRTNISKCLDGERKTAGGYTWRKKEDI